MTLLHLTRKRIIALITALIIPGTVLAASKAQVGPLKRHLQVNTAQVKRGSISQTVSASGEITAATQVDLKFQTSGQLAWVGVKEGDRVKKWQALASLDKNELEKRLQKDLSTYLEERTEFDDTQDQYPGAPLTDLIKRLKERAQIDLDQTVLDVEIRDIALKYSVLVSPIAGIVTHLDVPVAGVNITPAAAVFTVADPESLIFAAQVDETDIHAIKEGQGVQLTLDAFPDQKFSSQVSQISFTSQNSRGGGTVFLVKIPLPELEGVQFRIGMNGDAEFLVRSAEDVLTMPIEALLSDNQVWVKRGESFGKTEVKTGIETGAEIEILEGLSQGDEVVTSGFENLKG